MGSTFKVGDRVHVLPGNRSCALPGECRVESFCADGDLIVGYYAEDSDTTQRVRRADVFLLETPPAAKSEHQARKDRPLFRGCLDYFPDALMGVAEISRIGNEQHHPGAPLHWEKDKSSDHADCCARHLTDRGTKDSDGADHSGKAAWRALALYQTELEAANPELAKIRQAQRDAAAKGLR